MAVRYEAEAIRRPVAAGLLERTAGFSDDRAILVRQSARDPAHLMPRDERPKGRDEASATAANRPLTAGVTLIRDGPAVRHDD